MKNAAGLTLTLCLHGRSPLGHDARELCAFRRLVFFQMALSIFLAAAAGARVAPARLARHPRLFSQGTDLPDTSPSRGPAVSGAVTVETPNEHSSPGVTVDFCRSVGGRCGFAAAPERS